MVTDTSFIMLSGGPDSSALSYWLVHEKQEKLKGIYIHHGQPSGDGELREAKAVAASLDIQLKEIDLRTLWNSFGDISHGHATLIGGCGDNYALIPLAANYVAWAHGKRLYLGIHKSDVEGQPWILDLVQSYQQSLSVVRPSLTGYPPGGEEFADLKLLHPFADKTKVEVFQLGASLGAPLHLTWSCESSFRFHCGTCRGCERRRKTFQLAGVEDTTTYLAVPPSNGQSVGLAHWSLAPTAQGIDNRL